MYFRSTSGILIALYEAVQFNRNFMIMLTHCQTSMYELHPSVMQQTQIVTNNTDLKSSIDNQFTNLLVIFFQYW